MDTQPYAPLLNLPAWLGQAAPHRHQALKDAKPLLSGPLLQAPGAQRARLNQLNAEHWHALNSVDSALQNLQDAKAFAKPILEDALLTRFGLRLDSESVYLYLYIPQHLPWLTLPSGGARTRKVSLLDAALYNFEYQETAKDAYEPASTYITQPSATGQFQSLPAIRQALPITVFTRLCRDLDIGARYTSYLRTQLGMDEPAVAAALQQKVSASQKAALRVALQVAQLQKDIQPADVQLIEAVIAGRSDLALKGHDLSLMETPLSGILVFAADLDQSNRVERLVVYVPDDPEHPLKAYSSSIDFQKELVRQLRSEDYQAFFSRFVAHEHRGVFFGQLNQRLSRITWHPPTRDSNLAPWRQEPIENPKLQFLATAVEADLWQHLYQQALNKLLNDARTQAVSTASADRKARWALWDSFVEVASSILNAVLLVATPLVPGLGELMLGYMAYQLLDEVFEGVIDWAEGEAQEAFTHLMGVLQSLVQLGTFAVGGKIAVTELRKLLPADVVAFFDRFKPVTLANGNKRYWKPDLTPYRHPGTLPPHARVNAQGLHSLQGESVLALEGQLYALEKAEGSEHYRIKHPTRPDAYRPTVRHNGTGAWHTELEHPLHWDRPTLLNRLGHKVRGLSAADRELALRISGTEEDALRKMHVNSQPMPPLLEDTLVRLRIDRGLQQLIDNLRSDDSAVYPRIEPQALLQLLTTQDVWPPTRSLRFLDEKGQVTWTFGDPNQPAMQILETQLQNGELLKSFLQSLSLDEIRALFAERIGDPELSLETRTHNLRKKLAETAERHRAALFDSRYGSLPDPTPPTQQILQEAPGLPVSVAKTLLEHASGEELEIVDQGRTPPRLVDLARAALDEVRVNRAYEGQHMASQSNIDTDRLALNSLKLLPGWSDQVLLEARHRSVDGELWNTVGPAEAPIRRTLVRLDSGRYVPHDASDALSGQTDLYTAILHALPDAQRDALNIGIHDGPVLKERLAKRPLPREELRVLLNEPTPQEVRVETLRLLGNSEGYVGELEPPPPLLTLQQRTRALFPVLRDEQVQQLIDNLQQQPGGALVAIATLESDYQQLETILYTWQDDVPANHPVSGAPLTRRQRQYQRQNRRHFAARLKGCWRQETEIDDYYNDPARDGVVLKLDWPILGELPPLNSEFPHVSLLTLTGVDGTQGVTHFLEHFPMLRHLEVREIALGELPPALSDMPNLRTLSLDNCQIVLTAESEARLVAMNRLESLNLHQNPLGRAPDIRTMTSLEDLDLSETGIDQWPAGLLQLPTLEVVLLGDNRLSELPAALFELPPSASERFDLAGNPLSEPTLERFKAYYQRHQTYWIVDAADVDRRDARLLFPSLSHQDINQFIFSLPGDIEAGRRELARLANELETLQQELGAWTSDTTLAELERARRQAVQQRLERSWRRETAPDGNFIHALTLSSALAGELPAMSAQFKHITYLKLDGNGLALQPGAFLRSFAELDTLTIEQARLGDIPGAIFDLPKLTDLSLPNCMISLSETSQAALGNMSNLDHLDLSHNPLGRVPDFRGLDNLSHVSLQDTGLREVPEGLLIEDRPVAVNLSHNAIEELPAFSFSLPPTLTQLFDLSANPLSPQTLERIKIYCQDMGEFFNAQAPRAERDRVKALYPRLSDNAADRFIFNLPGNMAEVTTYLARLEAEYQQLGADLQQWVLSVPARHPVLDVPLDEPSRAEEQLRRRDFKRLLEQAWRRETEEDTRSPGEDLTYRLTVDLTLMGELPRINARFEHISLFDFTGDGTTTAVDATLDCFPNLQTLKLRHCYLRSLPRALFKLPKLTYLDLSHCAITLTADTARTVSELSALEFLGMNHNPLGLAPDVSGLNNLLALQLRNNQMSSVPHGVFRLPRLQLLDLGNNQISTIPLDLLEMIPTLLDECDLSGNPLSAQSLQHLRTYYQRTGQDFQVPEAARDEQGDPLPVPVPQPQEE